MENGETFTPVGVIQLNASAGSGKTHALALRYLSLLLRSPAPGEEMGRILAVTFTRKAAGEMRERILAWLEGLPRSDGKEIRIVREALLRQTGLPRAVLSARAEEALGEIFLRWPYFAVGTIDSFLTAAARASAFEVGLPHGFEVALSVTPRLRRALLGLLAEAGRDEGLRRDLLRLFEEMLVSQPDTSWNVVEEFLKEQKNLHDRMAGMVTFPQPLEEAERALEEHLEKVGRAAEEVRRCIEERGLAIKNGAAFLRQLDEIARRPSVGSFQRAESQHWKKESLHDFVQKRCADNVGPEEEEAWRKLRRSLGAAVLCHAVALGNPALHLHERLAAALDDEARRENAVLLEEVTRRLVRHLGRGSLPSVYLSLGERYTHLLVDEFQDTSELQWMALSPLAEEALSRGGSFFFVGDPKQVLYRFRGGAPHLFGEVFDDLGCRFQGEARDLPVNYRSRKVLVDFFNETFSVEALRRWAVEKATVTGEDFDAVVAPFFRFQPQQSAPDREGGYVRIVRFSPAEDGGGEKPLEQAARQTVDELVPDLLQRGYAPGEVAFLVRKNAEAEVITRVLEEAGRRVATESSARVTSHPRVQELLALLRFLDAPTDDLSFAAFASGALMEKASGPAPADLHALFCRWASRREGALYRAYREAFPRAWEAFVEPLFQGVGYLSPYDLIQDFLERSGAFARFPDDEAFLSHFLEVVSRKEREGAATAGSLLDSLKEDPEEEGLAVPLPEGGDAFRVLTVHKAKGLGFPVVVLLLPDLELEGDNTFFVPVEEKVHWARLRTWSRALAPPLEEAWQRSKVLSLRDELCAFYVALTRAREELHIVLGGPPPRGSVPPPVVPFEVGAPCIHEKKGDPQARLLTRLPSRSPWRSRILPPADPAYRPPTPEAGEAVRWGKLVHGALEAGFQGKEGEERILITLGAGPAEARELAGRLRALLAHPLLGPFLNPPSGEVLNETEIVDAEGRIHRVDRLVVEKDRVTVVDWKTGQEESEAHREQVARYCRLVSALYPGREVRGRVVYLVLEKVEEVPW